jgi:hypothetical protein
MDTAWMYRQESDDLFAMERSLGREEGMGKFSNSYVQEEGYFLNCVDPGGDTGMSLFLVKPKELKLVDYATIPYDPHRSESMPTSKLIEWKLSFPGIHNLVFEDFHLRNNSAEKDVTALKVIGSIDQMIFERNLYQDVVAQEPVEAKHMVTDEVLERLDLHMSHAHHQRHVRDANRHGITLLARLRYLPVCRVAYPRGGGVMNPLRPGSPRSSDSTPAKKQSRQTPPRLFP